MNIETILIKLSLLSDVFVGSESDVKLIGLLVFLISIFLFDLVLRKSYFGVALLSKIRIKYNVVFTSILLLSLLGLIMYLNIVIKRFPIFLPYNNIYYVSGEKFDKLVNPIHNHILKPSIAIILNIFNKRISSSNYRYSLIYLDYYDYKFYSLILLAFAFTIFINIILMLQLFKKNNFLRNLSISILLYIQIKGLIDGGFFCYEFITSSLILYLIFKKIEVYEKSMTVILFIVSTLEYCLTVVTVGYNFYYKPEILGFNLTVLGFYLFSLRYIKRGLLFLALGFFISLLFSPSNRKNITSVFSRVSGGERLLIGTSKTLNLPVYRKYKYFTDYIYEADEDTTFLEIAKKYDENPKYNLIAKYDECIKVENTKEYEFILYTQEELHIIDEIIGDYKVQLSPSGEDSVFKVSIIGSSICEFREDLIFTQLLREVVGIDKLLFVRVK